MGALGSRLESVALDALLRTCRELALPLPTLPSYRGIERDRGFGRG
jgi:hypothetical protein